MVHHTARCRESFAEKIQNMWTVDVYLRFSSCKHDVALFYEQPPRGGSIPEGHTTRWRNNAVHMYVAKLHGTKQKKPTNHACIA